MSSDEKRLTGPRFKPAKKWLIGFAILAFCALMLAFGVSTGIPLRAKEAGWAIYALVLFGGSLYLILRYLILGPRRGSGRSFGQIALFPRSWQRWILDEPQEKSKL